MDLDKFHERLEHLIEEGEKLIALCPSVQEMGITGGGIELDMTHSKWRLSCLNLIRNYFGENHYFYGNLKSAKCSWTRVMEKGEHHFRYCKESIAGEIAVLSYIKEELELGLVQDAQHLYQSELFSNLLEQAFNLCDKGYIIASAVFGRLIIENYINDLLRTKKIELGEKEFLSDKLVKLRKAEVIDLPTERVIQSHYDIGTYATHGKEEFKKYTSEKIKDFLQTIQNKILTIS